VKITLEHIAIWTPDLENLKDYYVKFFNAGVNEKYFNPVTNLETYFLTFAGGSSIEIMQMPGISINTQSDTQCFGLTHIAFGVETMEMVRDKAEELRKAGFAILRGPRKTGDGFYEFETIDPDSNRIEVTTKYIE
jgi:lactoylglutathione lyase